MQDKLQKETQAQKQLNEELKQKQKTLKENEAVSKKQLKMWRDLQALLEVKKQCLEKKSQTTQGTGSLTKDHLVL
jgi:ribosomal protein S8